MVYLFLYKKLRETYIIVRFLYIFSTFQCQIYWITKDDTICNPGSAPYGLVNRWSSIFVHKLPSSYIHGGGWGEEGTISLHKKSSKYFPAFQTSIIYIWFILKNGYILSEYSKGVCCFLHISRP